MINSPISPSQGDRLDDCWNRIGVRGDGSCPELTEYIHCRNCPVYAAAAARLLDVSAPPGYLAQWTGHYAQPREEAESETLSLFLFRLGAEWLALPSGALREVATLRRIHPLPHRREGAVLGLVNIGGELLVCVSLGGILGLDPASRPEGGERPGLKRLLVVEDGAGGKLVFPVDEAHGIRHSPPDALKEIPSTVARAAAAHTQGFLPWEGRSVGCLDGKLLFAALNRSLA